MCRNTNYWYMLPVQPQEVQGVYFLALRNCPPATLMPALILLKIFLSSWYSSHLLLLKNCLSVISLFLTWRLRSQFASCLPCAEFTQKFCHWEICSVDTVLCEITMFFSSFIYLFIHSLKNSFRIDRMYWSEFNFLKALGPMILCALIASDPQTFMSCKDTLWTVWGFSEQQYV